MRASGREIVDRQFRWPIRALGLLVVLCGLLPSPGALAAERDKRILIALSNVAEIGDPEQHAAANNLWEVVPAFHVFRMHGYAVDFVSPRGGRVPFTMDVDEVDPPGMIAYAIRYEGFLEQVHASQAPAGVDASRYAGVFIGGGLGPLFDVAQDMRLLGVMGRLHEAGGVVGACGHGPGSLGNVRRGNGDYLVKGRRVTGFPNSSEINSRWSKQGTLLPFLVEDRLRARGARFLTKDDLTDKFDPVIDGRLVTAMFLSSCAVVAEEMTRLMGE